MLRSIWLLLVLILVMPVEAGDLEKRVKASRLAVKTFMGQLKGELQAAMKAGGPVNAIKICKLKAPAIAARISKMHGWRVARTSLKLRNPANAPDAWEKKVLKKFEARKRRGENPAAMEYYAVVKQNGRQVFRYMKAIPTAGLCLTCHGHKIDPKVSIKLKQLYPNDQARGFKVGDIRGAFTITQPMD